jgi:hypothetical protein
VSSNVPKPVSALAASGEIGRIRLTWKSEPYQPFVDHYAVYASRQPSVPIGPETLLGKTIYPHFVHSRLGGEAQTWHYRVVVVEAAGYRSAPSRTVAGTSLASIAVTGQPIATIGTFDHKSLELALAPNGYAQYPARFPSGPDFTDGVSDPATDWSYIHPGPSDAWANRKAWKATFRFQLASVPASGLWLSIWLIDTHATIPGSAVLGLGGSEFTTVSFEGGATRGSLEGDATRPGSPLRPSYVELELPRDRLVAGENVLTIDKRAGSWHAYDALGVFLPRSP